MPGAHSSFTGLRESLADRQTQSLEIIMQFQITPEYVKKQNRKSTFFALFVAVLAIACVGMLLDAKSLSDMVFPAIGLLLFTPPMLGTYRIIKAGADAYPVLDLDESAGVLSVSCKDVVVTVEIPLLKNLRLQFKSDTLASVIVTTSAGQVMRFEGYESLEVLAAALERLTPAERTTNSKPNRR